MMYYKKLINGLLGVIGLKLSSESDDNYRELELIKFNLSKKKLDELTLTYSVLKKFKMEISSNYLYYGETVYWTTFIEQIRNLSHKLIYPKTVETPFKNKLEALDYYRNNKFNLEYYLRKYDVLSFSKIPDEYKCKSIGLIRGSLIFLDIESRPHHWLECERTLKLCKYDYDYRNNNNSTDYRKHLNDDTINDMGIRLNIYIEIIDIMLIDLNNQMLIAQKEYDKLVLKRL